MTSRQIVLDTETTGLEVSEGNRIIEIGCIELVNRRPTGNNFQRYLNPDRDSEGRAEEVHGLTREFLADKPRFAEVLPALLEYLRGAELLIHNAPFDCGFLNAELERAGSVERIEAMCAVTDTVLMARRMHPGQKVGLDALCKRYSVDNSHREFHGALLDARLLADVYIAMTSGQDALFGEAGSAAAAQAAAALEPLKRGALKVIRATAEELDAHRARLKEIAKKAGRLFWPDEPPAAA